MTAWLTSLRDRPIAESERARAMAAVTVLLIAAAILLALSQPSSGPRPGGGLRRTSSTRSAPGIVQNASASRARASDQTLASDSGPVPLTPRAARAADLFLAGYLGYLYGHAPASAIDGATPVLLRSLRAHPPRISPGIRGRRPRVVSLHSAPASSGLLGVSVVINDGGLVDYSIGLLLVSHGGRLLASGLEGGA